MSSHPALRLSVAAPPAAAVVLALFAAMSALVAVREIELEPASVWVLKRITPAAPADVDWADILKPEPIEPSVPPPAPPPLEAVETRVDGWRYVPVGAAPKAFEPRPPVVDLPPAATVPDVDARPLAPLQPIYPQRAIARSLEGSCEVRLNVDVRGAPHNLKAVCTDEVFVSAAIAAVRETRFAPKIVRGRPAARRGVVYPIQFDLN